ncbi:MAG: DNA polymerase IV [Oscillospiraceae bacterium]|jgi:DNA polymerase-4|nr:DNA polymerase IV [Oscillospiraceae bacterium]
MTRDILHSDLNSYYASVEMVLDPSLRGKAVAVCGSGEDRRGIVLAKSDSAKRAGVKTGMASWQARALCPGLITVPPHYEQYLEYSRLTRSIYERYTDLVEPFGMDECWLDVTGCPGGAEGIAEDIRQSVKRELGLTVSIGVSYTKVVAKLASDMRKPDAITVISREDYKRKVWPLPAGDMLCVGRATAAKLAMHGVKTVGDVARLPPEVLQCWFGKNGAVLWMYANGIDESRVAHMDYEQPVKSVGHGTTCVTDLCDNGEVWRVMLYLTQDIGHRLRKHRLEAHGVQIGVKACDFSFKQYQARLDYPTQSPMELAEAAHRLFAGNYSWYKPVRAITVRAIRLSSDAEPVQLELFSDSAPRERRRRLDDAVETIRQRYGAWSIHPASLLGDDTKLPGTSLRDVIMPGAMHV